MSKDNTCVCTCHMMFPILVILFAMLFLLGNLNYIPQNMVGVVWPILVGLAGVLKLGQAKCGCC